MKNPFACFFRSVLDRFRRTSRIPAEPARGSGQTLSPEQFRELLIEAVEDPATARFLTRRLLLPFFPIQGGAPIGADEVCPGAFGTTGCSAGDYSFPNGNVGIGTSTPSRKLQVQNDVAGLARVEFLNDAAGANQTDLMIGKSSATATLFVGTNYAGSANAFIDNRSGGSLLFKNTGADAIAITSGGNVGIGTMTPGKTLSVNGVIGVGSNEIPIQETYFGDFTSYRVLRLGLDQATRSLALGVDPRTVAGGNFSGIGQILLGNKGVLAPNATGADWMGVLRATAGKVYLGGTLSSGELAGDGLVVSSTKVGIGTTNPLRPLHVKGGDIMIEPDPAAGGGLAFLKPGETNPRTVIYRDASDFAVLRNTQQVYTILKVWAPQESSFPTTPREATLTLLRALDDETKTEFLDLYNNYYTDEKQYGIRIAKKGTGTSFHDFVFDQWDQDQAKKTPVMILKADGKVGIGTDVPGARLEAADPSVLAGENLTNGALTSGTSWSRTGDMALTANAATYTHSTGAGTLTQASANFAIAAKPYRLYLFTYTISGVSGEAPSATITTAFAAASRPLVTKASGTYTVMLHAAASPGDFVINVTSSAAGSFTIDSLSLKEVTGGDIIADGLFTGGGTTGVKVDGSGNVGIGTASPGVALDVVGGLATRRADIALGNGDNNNVALSGTTFAKVSGPTLAFAVTGFPGGSDGRVLLLYNSTSKTMTVKNNNAGSAAANRILTLTGADVALRANAQSFATFIYDSAQSLWVLVATN